MEVFKVTKSALSNYIEYSKKSNYSIEIAKRRLTAHINACQMTGSYRDIGENKTVYNVGKMKIVTLNNLILKISITEGNNYFPKDYSYYLRKFSSELGISKNGKNLE